MLVAAPAAIVEAAPGDHAFAANLFRAARRPGNLVLSPASVGIALAMTAAGALGETQTEMRRALHLEHGGPQTDAIYFKASWSQPFETSATADAEFFAGAQTVRVPTMQVTSRYGFGEVAGAKVLELPYGDGSVAMVLVVPNAKDGLGVLEEAVRGASFAEWLRALHSRRVRLSLPRFNAAAAFGLAEALRSLGMKAAFTRGANFSAMDGSRDLFLSEVLHSAFIHVTEQGTEAAAATAVTLREGMARREQEPVELKVDRPFLFFIRDVKSGCILFMGRIIDPSGRS